jgi:hypothetical protein
MGLGDAFLIYVKFLRLSRETFPNRVWERDGHKKNRHLVPNVHVGNALQ